MNAHELLADLRREGIDLWLDGGQIRYRSLPGKLTQEFRLAIQENRIEIVNALAFVGNQNVTRAHPSAVHVENESLPVSFMQERFVRMYEDLASPLFAHISLIRYSNSPFRLQALHSATQELLRRHTVLRSRYSRDSSGRVRATIADSCDYDFKHVDLCELHESVQKQKAIDALALINGTRFNLELGPLVRVGVVKLARAEEIVIFVFHHSVMDAWSAQVAIDELSALYAASCRNESAQLRAVPVQFTDYVQYQRQWLETDNARSKLEYWRRRISGAEDAFWLPVDRKVSVTAPYDPERTRRGISPEHTATLRKLAKSHGTTLFTIALTAFAVLLCKWTRRREIFTRVCHFGRPRSELHSAIGCFLNEWLLRAAAEEASCFVDVLQTVKSAYLEALPTFELPGIKMWECMPARRGKPYQVTSFNYLTSSIDMLDVGPEHSNGSTTKGNHERLSALVRGVPLADYLEPSTELALVVTVKETAAGLAWSIGFDPHLFEDRTISSFSTAMADVLSKIALDPYITVSALPTPAQSTQST